jgi:predicted Kef-type K+ transport protein
MLKRLRRALVESFVGAIALGWLFAEAIIHFAWILGSPVATWLARRDGLSNPTASSATLHFQTALPELIKFVTQLFVGYALLRWLYYKPLDLPTAPKD